ncbi:hypothetical protein AB0O75_49830 [Streptomyces sp. NPDC088921]|uniref:hypothetical protein n=1 Tax=unclassified Streptomyces TaxID=2593676 RepID=UPI0034223A63
MTTERADAQLVWRERLVGGSRPRIEPSDPTGQLLMEYLLSGMGATAAAAARAVEAFRGAAECLDWTVPSYTQLLIGYAYAAGRDTARLSAWCRRTGAAEHLGSDGSVLAASAAYWSGDRKRARKLLATVDGAPTLVFGGELALLITTLLDGRGARGPAPRDRGRASREYRAG